jgi:hypothetical protein
LAVVVVVVVGVMIVVVVVVERWRASQEKDQLYFLSTQLIA